MDRNHKVEMQNHNVGISLKINFFEEIKNNFLGREMLKVTSEFVLKRLENLNSLTWILKVEERYESIKQQLLAVQNTFVQFKLLSSS